MTIVTYDLMVSMHPWTGDAAGDQQMHPCMGVSRETGRPRRNQSRIVGCVGRSGFGL